MSTWNVNNNCMSWALQDPTKWHRLKGFRELSHTKAARLFGIIYGFKPVEKKDMVIGKEYIALRITVSDFHFMRRGPQGHWTHKQGGWPVKVISQKQVFAKEWYRSGDNYGGPIWLFEVV